MTSPVDIGNLALDAIRARANVTSIFPSDGSLAADVISSQYQIRIDALFRAANWNCARSQATLTLLKAAKGTPENLSGALLPLPPKPWLYEYAWPSNPFCLKARFILPIINSASGAVPLTTADGSSTWFGGFNRQIPFLSGNGLDASGNRIRTIMTNQPQAELVYTARITDPDLWDSSFTEAAISALAAWICQPVSGNNQLAKDNIQAAGATIMAARLADANEGTSQVDNTPDWIQARWRGGSTFNSQSAVPAQTWDAMSFPGGVVY